MFEKLNELLNRYEYLNHLLTQVEIISNVEIYKSYTIELADLTPVILKYKEYLDLQNYYSSLQDEAVNQFDIDLSDLCKSEMLKTKELLSLCENELRQLLSPKNDEDTRNIIMEIRAGVGGDEAALFAEDLFNMYLKFAIKNNFEVSVTSSTEGNVCGIKEVCLFIKGKGAYSKFKYENGVHRVQRVPETEAKGRVHTSTATVLVIPERDDVEIKLDIKDIRVDLYHSSGKGGQNVNKVESAIRLTHIPTGIVVACQEERSQLQNKEKAFSVLRAKLFEYYNNQVIEKEASTKHTILGSGDRCEKIRTYNYPQHRITDHRINYTCYDLEKFMLGNIEELIEALQIAEYSASLAKE